MDLALVVDASGSIPSASWSGRILPFLTDIVSDLNIGKRAHTNSRSVVLFLYFLPNLMKLKTALRRSHPPPGTPLIICHPDRGPYRCPCSYWRRVMITVFSSTATNELSYAVGKFKNEVLDAINGLEKSVSCGISVNCLLLLI
jgi:hypothetical protein